MKIWFDLTNSPHVNIFNRMIREVEKEHEIIITCRPLANTIELLDLAGLPYHVVGNHYGQHTHKKAVGFVVRIMQLLFFLRGRHVDAAISHSSFYSPLVSKLLDIRCIYLNDNEQAQGNKIAFLCADTVMVPEFLDNGKVEKQWANKNKIIKYPGVKEGVYLWANAASHFCEKKKSGMRQTIYIRPEPWTAQYYKGARNFMDDLLFGLKYSYDTVLLPRGDIQKAYYQDARFNGITVPNHSIDLIEIMRHCDAFIGAGGTMTREAAVLGIPTISIYQDNLLDVDRYLIKKGFMIHNKNPNVEFVSNFLAKNSRQSADKELLIRGRKAYELIKTTLMKE